MRPDQDPFKRAAAIAIARMNNEHEKRREREVQVLVVERQNIRLQSDLQRASSDAFHEAAKVLKSGIIDRIIPKLADHLYKSTIEHHAEQVLRVIEDNMSSRLEVRQSTAFDQCTKIVTVFLREGVVATRVDSFDIDLMYDNAMKDEKDEAFANLKRMLGVP